MNAADLADEDDEDEDHPKWDMAMGLFNSCLLTQLVKKLFAFCFLFRKAMMGHVLFGCEIQV